MSAFDQTKVARIMSNPSKRILDGAEQCHAYRGGLNIAPHRKATTPVLLYVVAPGNLSCASCIGDDRKCLREGNLPAAGQSLQSQGSMKRRSGRATRSMVDQGKPPRESDSVYIESLLIDRDAVCLDTVRLPSRENVRKAMAGIKSVLTGKARCTQCKRSGF